jgi:hypothetical protein
MIFAPVGLLTSFLYQTGFPKFDQHAFGSQRNQAVGSFDQYCTRFYLGCRNFFQ